MKRSHWTWFIFPQLAILGHSWNAKYYGINGYEKAEAYLKHPILGVRLREVTNYLDDVFHKRMVITHRKGLCQGDYLIDDRGKNGTSEFSGEWIEFGSEKFPDWNSVLEYLNAKEH